jgi:PleD family two-component response regulator
VSFKVTASIGLSVRLLHENGSVSELIKAADDCLYLAKSLGRNQVFSPSVVREEATH